MFEVERRTEIIHDVHEGIGDNSMAKALAAHRGSESTYQKISERLFWHGMVEDIEALYEKGSRWRQYLFTGK